MKTLIVTPKNDEDFVFLAKLFKKLDFSYTSFNLKDIEDSYMLEMMKKSNQSKKTSRDVILKKLIS